MANVYAWPPVAHVAAEWSQIAPVGRSRSLITGASYVSAAQRRRRVARLDVSALSLDRNGAGYIEALKRLLDGGVHLVRLHSTPIIWHLDDEAGNARRTKPMSWIVPTGGIAWSVPPGDIDWWTGPGVTDGEALSGNRVRVTGLPADTDVVRPGEFVTMNGETAMVLRPARSNRSGVAILYLVTPLSGAGPIHIGARETGVFEADEIPRAVQPVGQNWQYSWSFTEVFADERGPFVEVDPWS
ncbi:hypothetical protein [Paracoccus sp. (in: a-proteobacteria)]|uniref:hypothetical protein n=1 Tax=Paracoccus sp. TaxID=267 RepID=UPI0028AFD81B|nr:hypothetical protein [Paracoccus sp. (in: a-proteobacteria)]